MFGRKKLQLHPEELKQIHDLKIDIAALNVLAQEQREVMAESKQYYDEVTRHCQRLQKSESVDGEQATKFLVHLASDYRRCKFIHDFMEECIQRLDHLSIFSHGASVRQWRKQTRKDLAIALRTIKGSMTQLEQSRKGLKVRLALE